MELDYQTYEILKGVLIELEGFTDPVSSWCEKLLNEHTYWKERIDISSSKESPCERLEELRKELYIREVEEALHEASETAETIPLSLASIVELHEGMPEDLQSLRFHREAFSLAYFIHWWKVSTKTESKASEVISMAYDSVYPPRDDDLHKLIAEKAPELLRPIPVFVREALKYLVDNGDIICAGAWYVPTRSLRDTRIEYSQTLNYEFYRQWVRKPDGSQYSRNAFDRNRYNY